MIDPTSIHAPKLSSLLLMLRDRLGIKLDVFILPDMKTGYRDMPLEFYYRYEMESSRNINFTAIPSHYTLEAEGVGHYLIGSESGIEGDKSNTEISFRHNYASNTCNFEI